MTPRIPDSDWLSLFGDTVPPRDPNDDDDDGEEEDEDEDEEPAVIREPDRTNRAKMPICGITAGPGLLREAHEVE